MFKFTRKQYVINFFLIGMIDFILSRTGMNVNINWGVIVILQLVNQLARSKDAGYPLFFNFMIPVLGFLLFFEPRSIQCLISKKNNGNYNWI